MTTTAFTEPTPGRKRKQCGCGDRVEVEVIIQARPKTRRGTLATRCRSMCRDCAQRAFNALESTLDQIANGD